jgi:hypothetical protein
MVTSIFRFRSSQPKPRVKGCHPATERGRGLTPERLLRSELPWAGRLPMRCLRGGSFRNRGRREREDLSFSPSATRGSRDGLASSCNPASRGSSFAARAEPRVESGEAAGGISGEIERGRRGRDAPHGGRARTQRGTRLYRSGETPVPERDGPVPAAVRPGTRRGRPGTLEGAARYQRGRARTRAGRPSTPEGRARTRMGRQVPRGQRPAPGRLGASSHLGTATWPARHRQDSTAGGPRRSCGTAAGSFRKTPPATSVAVLGSPRSDDDVTLRPRRCGCPLPPPEC